MGQTRMHRKARPWSISASYSKIPGLVGRRCIMSVDGRPSICMYIGCMLCEDKYLLIHNMSDIDVMRA
jgi:hypothetical protein